MSELTTLAADQATGRELRCRYLKKSGYRCPNPIAGEPDQGVLLCPKHLHEAWQQFTEALEQAEDGGVVNGPELRFGDVVCEGCGDVVSENDDSHLCDAEDES